MLLQSSLPVNYLITQQVTLVFCQCLLAVLVSQVCADLRYIACSWWWWWCLLHGMHFVDCLSCYESLELAGLCHAC